MGFLPGIGGLIGRPAEPEFGAYHVGSAQASLVSNITVSGASPNVHSSRLIAAFVSHEGTRTLAALTVNGSSATRYTTTANSLVSSIALIEFPAGTSVSVSATFSGNLNYAGYLDVYELIGATIDGVVSKGTSTASGTQILQSGPANFDGGMSLSMMVGSGSSLLTGTPQNAPTELQHSVVNSAYVYRAGLWLPDSDGSLNTFGQNGMATAAYSFMAVGLPPAA